MRLFKLLPPYCLPTVSPTSSSTTNRPASRPFRSYSLSLSVSFPLSRSPYLSFLSLSLCRVDRERERENLAVADFPSSSAFSSLFPGIIFLSYCEVLRKNCKFAFIFLVFSKGGKVAGAWTCPSFLQHRLAGGLIAVRELVQRSGPPP